MADQAAALIANARMYDVAPGAGAAWAALFDWVAERSGVALEVVAHPAPAPLDTLWARPDLGAVFMCGWPFARARPQPRLIAAPIPAPDRFGGRPLYATDLVVRRDSPFERLSDAFGGRLAWTATHSHSGFNAVRRHLLDHRSAERPRLFRETVGPVITPRAALQSVLDGRADVAPLDAYALALTRRHAPDRVAGIRVIDTTALAPIPPLVARAAIDAATAARLSDAFLAVADAPELAAIRDALALSGFARPDPAVYAVTEVWAEQAIAAGYPAPM